jgi:hypothetical protein
LSQVPLPLGWRKDSHELEEWPERFSNDKEESVFFDPRLTAAALKQRGVDIQTINLIRVDEKERPVCQRINQFY